jgi:guanosine-3',5'-bis(diphosphate) 3'-pyrophosphohydrolase
MTNEEKTLQEIIAFADRAHDQQIRRYAGDRYIVHPIRVMETCRQYNNEIAVLAAAILHDVLEDTLVSREQLEAFLHTVMNPLQVARTLQFVIELTDVYIKEDYPKLNRTKRKRLEANRMAAVSAEAQTIKYADIIDNAPEIAEQDPDFARRFLAECRVLLKGMKQGSPDLHERAIKTVNDALHQLKV